MIYKNMVASTTFSMTVSMHVIALLHQMVVDICVSCAAINIEKEWEMCQFSPCINVFLHYPIHW